MKQKKEAQAKATRRDIATLLEKGKVETARIKVESLSANERSVTSVIHEDIHVELLELLELYCEMLLARFGLLDQNSREPDIGVKESVCSIVYAAPRTEVKELHILRDILMHKYGRDFSLAVMENRDSCVSDRIIRKLDIATPSSELVDAYLHEIAKGYSVDWSPTRNVEDNTEAALKDSVSHVETTPTINESKDAKKGNTPDLDLGDTKLPNVAPSTEDNPETTKDGPGKPPPYSSAKQSSDASGSSPKPPPDDLDALMKRFAALKKP
ncbi:hypothetical protein DXG01_001045 [Tephrocybe rancida]|nr:hypothetical protein DXG01_001045 [Tephrocybe rancida]